MTESIIGTIINGHFIIDMQGVSRYTVLRTGAALFKADVPAAVIDFKEDNIDYIANFTRLLADRFGPDIIICADGIKNKKLAKKAVKAGVRAAFCSADKKIIGYLKKKKVAVFVSVENKSELALSEALSVDAVRIPDFTFKTMLPKILKSNSFDSFADAFSGDFIPEFSAPVITEELLKNESYDKMELNAREIIKNFK